MIEDFLDINRIESGKYEINKYPFDLLNVVLDGLSGLEHSASLKQIKLLHKLPRKMTPLLGDETLMTQVVMNLLDNAVKYSPNGSTVQIEVQEHTDMFLISVEDNGPGIRDEEKSKIFEKFIRGSGDKGAGGFGLGLSFVREVIEGHDGKIGVEDAEESGAVFIIQLPKREN